LVIGTFGATQIAAHQIAMIVSGACFMVPLGIAMATTVRIGHAVGAGDRSAVRWSAAAGYAITGLVQTLSALLLFYAGARLAAWITPEPAVIALATTLMVYAAVFQYPDGLQAMSAGALRGLKDTTVPMFITVLAYWGLGLPLGAWLGIYAGQGATGLWTGLICGLSVAATLLTWRFWRLAQHH
jgi:MATE family multidrug resistance protein